MVPDSSIVFPQGRILYRYSSYSHGDLSRFWLKGKVTLVKVMLLLITKELVNKEYLTSSCYFWRPCYIDGAVRVIHHGLFNLKKSGIHALLGGHIIVCASFLD